MRAPSVADGMGLRRRRPVRCRRPVPWPPPPSAHIGEAATPSSRATSVHPRASTGRRPDDARRRFSSSSASSSGRRSSERCQVTAPPASRRMPRLRARSPKPFPPTRPTRPPSRPPNPTPSPSPAPTEEPTSLPPGDVADLCEIFFDIPCGLGAGRYAPARFSPAFDIELGDGWSNAAHTADTVALTRDEGRMTFASGGHRGLSRRRDARAAQPRARPDRGVHRDERRERDPSGDRPHRRSARPLERPDATIDSARVQLFADARDDVLPGARSHDPRRRHEPAQGDDPAGHRTAATGSSWPTSSRPPTTRPPRSGGADRTGVPRMALARRVVRDTPIVWSTATLEGRTVAPMASILRRLTRERRPDPRRHGPARDARARGGLRPRSSSS